MPDLLKRRPVGGIEIPKPPKQELIKAASDRRIGRTFIEDTKPSLVQKIGKLGKGMGKLSVVSTGLDALDYANWQVKQNKRKKQGYGPEEGGGIL